MRVEIGKTYLLSEYDLKKDRPCVVRNLRVNRDFCCVEFLTDGIGGKGWGGDRSVTGFGFWNVPTNRLSPLGDGNEMDID